MKDLRVLVSLVDVGPVERLEAVSARVADPHLLLRPLPLSALPSVKNQFLVAVMSAWCKCDCSGSRTYLLRFAANSALFSKRPQWRQILESSGPRFNHALVSILKCLRPEPRHTCFLKASLLKYRALLFSSHLTWSSELTMSITLV